MSDTNTLAMVWHYATELRTLSVPYPLTLTNTTDILSEMCPLKHTVFFPVFVQLIVHNLTRAAYPQWLSQVVMTGARTGYPQMGEPAL